MAAVDARRARRGRTQNRAFSFRQQTTSILYSVASLTCLGVALNPGFVSIRSKKAIFVGAEIAFPSPLVVGVSADTGHSSVATVSDNTKTNLK